MVRRERDRVLTGTHQAIETGEEIAKRPIEPEENVLDLVTVRSVIVTHLVECREADRDQVRTRQRAEMHRLGDAERHPREVLVGERTALPLVVEHPVWRPGGAREHVRKRRGHAAFCGADAHGWIFVKIRIRSEAKVPGPAQIVLHRVSLHELRDGRHRAAAER